MKYSTSPAPLEGSSSAVLVTPALDPELLGDVSAAAETALLLQGESENTIRSYRTALRYWAAWFALRYQKPIALPVSVATVVQFIVDHAQRLDHESRLQSELPADIDRALVAGGYKGKLGPPALTTLVHRVAVISKAHQLSDSENPCEQPRVRELLAQCRRGYAKRGALPNKKAALTKEPLEALLATCDDSLAGLRDRALLLFAFSSGGRRRSEVAGAAFEHLRREGLTYLYDLRVSKSNQTGQDRAENEKPIAGRAAQALTAWLTAAKIKEGALFRRVRRGGVIGEGAFGGGGAEDREGAVRACGASGGLLGALVAVRVRDGSWAAAGAVGGGDGADGASLDGVDGGVLSSR